MSLNKSNSNTYVGDYFTLNFLKADDDPLKIFNGYRCKLLGFKKEIRPIFNHQLNALVRQPGFYETIGDPIVKLETDKLIQIPLIHLLPEDYRFTDNLLKNKLFLEEKRKYRFVRELPSISYNIGDIVLVANHFKYSDDFLSEILDINIKGSGVHYIVSPSDVITDLPQEIRYDKIIDIVQHGELTELERLGRLQRCYESLSERRISRYRYTDDENTQLPED